MLRQWLPVLFSAALLVITSCSGERSGIPADVVNIPNTASGKMDESTLPVIRFDKTEHDFGKVIQGEKVSFLFRFTNTGKGDLVISSISASCGCTATEYPKTPIKPGGSDIVKVTFDSSGRQGFQNKEITVSSNTQPSTTRLFVKAQVFIPERR
jgi:hypothetical protein